MVALIVIAAGYALIFGARGIFDRLVRTVAGLVLILSFLPGVVSRAARFFDRPLRFHPPAATVAVLVGVGLALVGFLAWRLRPVLARRAEARRRRNGAPRERARQPAPKDDVA